MKLLDGLFNGRTELQTDLNEWINLLAFDVISDFAFGKTFGFLERGDDFLGLVKVVNDRLNSASAIGNLPLWIQPCMLKCPDRFWRAGVEGILSIRALVQSSYEERVASSDNQREDLMRYMLHAKSEGGESLPKGRILAQSTAMIIAGSDSTAASTIHFVDKVSRDLGLQERVRAEIDEVFPGNPDDNWVPIDAHLTSLAYTKAVLYEVLRLTPTLGIGLERTVTQAGTVFTGYKLPPGTHISVPTYSVHRNADVYPDPEVFKPERWLGKDTDKQYQCFSIFSTGPRSCIGQNFAWMEMLKTICMLLKFYRIERVADGPTEYFDGFFIRATECNVRMEKRS